jgi:hypothetical protein
MLVMGDLGSAVSRWCLVAALLASASLPARASDCEAWPGEPRPLPQVDDHDPLRARWAELRAQELALRAADLETVAPVAAHRAWRRVLCLDPADERALAGALRSLPLRVHRPAIRVEADAAPAVSDTDVWRALDAPLQIAMRTNASPARGPGHLPPTAGEPAIEAPVRAESLWRIDRSLAAAEAQVTAARFEEALETVARARTALDALPPGRDLTAPRLRLELVAATAEAASGDSDGARACLARVLALEPGFAFDARTTSPKLLHLLDAARAEQGAAR